MKIKSNWIIFHLEIRVTRLLRCDFINAFSHNQPSVTMLLKEYRICMPLSVEEVSAKFIRFALYFLAILQTYFVVPCWTALYDSQTQCGRIKAR